ncbi:DUF1905 domain-containing protein [Jiangella gansuensis]|uniref:DUF1905 domain-containing protein n=1 Tax=Jiangella gansuensis TaxID=281473 RepID=UPI00047D6CFA|nr:DUF1905 domain-containing protein [Jiangella gansuensis]
MTSTAITVGSIDVRFTATIRQDDTPGGWAVVTVPASGELFGTRRPVKVTGTLDGQAFQATLLPQGDGTHMLPIRAALRAATGKGSGDEVAVHLDQRLS